MKKWALTPGTAVTYRKPYFPESQAKLIKAHPGGWWKARRSDGRIVDIMTPWIVDATPPRKPTETQGELFT
jgi:hypothetical protein